METREFFCSFFIMSFYFCFLSDFVLQLCKVFVFFFPLYSFVSQVLFSVLFTRIKALLPCLHRTQVILEASEKISIKRSRCTMVALSSSWKSTFSLREFRTITWPNWPESWHVLSEWIRSYRSLLEPFSESLKSRRRKPSWGPYHTPLFGSVCKTPASTLAAYDFQVILSISCSFSLLVESTLELTCDSDAAKMSNVPCRKHQTCWGIVCSLLRP